MICSLQTWARVTRTLPLRHLRAQPPAVTRIHQTRTKTASANGQIVTAEMQPVEVDAYSMALVVIRKEIWGVRSTSEWIAGLLATSLTK
jgi:hypothetical protein